MCNSLFAVARVRHWYPELHLESENQQTSSVRSATELKAKSLFKNGNAAANSSITFEIYSVPADATGYSLTPATTTTNANGQASTVFESGNSTGLFEIDATGNSIEYTNTNPYKFIIDQAGIQITGFEVNQDNNAYAFVGAEPSLPPLTISYVGSHGNAQTYLLQLKVQHCKMVSGVTERDSTFYYPSSSTYLSVPIANSINISALLGSSYRGGTATLYYRLDTDATVQSRTFYIRGHNPSKTAVYDYVSAALPDSLAPWFYKKMMVHESGSQTGSLMKQFNAEGTLNPSWTSSVSMPNWGPPDGWGITQVDLSTSNQSIPEQGLWNWKYNVRKGLGMLNANLNRTSSVAAGRGARQFWQQQVDAYIRYNSDNPGHQVAITPSTTYNNITFSYNPTTGQKSYRDAIWIKRYNGASPRHFLVWQNGHWLFSESNNSGLYYVRSICNTLE